MNTDISGFLFKIIPNVNVRINHNNCCQSVVSARLNRRVDSLRRYPEMNSDARMNEDARVANIYVTLSTACSNQTHRQLAKR